MHAGTFLGRGWGRDRVFVFGFLGFSVSRVSGFLAVLDVLLRVNVFCFVSMCCVIMCQLLVKVCKTLHINKWTGLFTFLS